MYYSISAENYAKIYKEYNFLLNFPYEPGFSIFFLFLNNTTWSDLDCDYLQIFYYVYL